MKAVEIALGVVYNVCFIGCFIPQIVKSVKTKSVEDVSIMLSIMSVVGYIAALGYAWMRFGLDPLLCTNYALSGVSAIVMIAVYYKYKQ